MKWLTYECPSLRTAGGNNVAAIVTEAGYTVCEPMPLETAQQIIREHNAHEGMVKALTDAIPFIGYQASVEDIKARCDVALELAGAPYGVDRPPIFWRAEWRGPHNIPHCHVIEAHAENLAISRAEAYAAHNGFRIVRGTLTVTPYDNN